MDAPAGNSGSSALMATRAASRIGTVMTISPHRSEKKLLISVSVAYARLLRRDRL
jgi:hypothetical protein